MVDLLYFAWLRERMGKPAETLALPPGVATIGALATHLTTVHAALEGRLKYVRFARNEEFAAVDTPLTEGDTIALIPPVAGG